ncbi:MAG: hypothetical protein LBB84_06135 [Tannerellaceae bacterium]|jgi:hypothetical protein|nr:hypothetical protein [Tannerellaceae bacterium]
MIKPDLFSLGITLLLLAGCGLYDAGTEKYQGKRDHIINVHDKVKEIVIGYKIYNLNGCYIVCNFAV